MTPRPIAVRPATEADAEAMLAIYAPAVATSAASFETVVPSVAEFATRIAKYSRGWAWLAAEDDGAVLGYAYAAPLRERAAYRWSTETSAYVAAAARRRGIGRSLYAALLARLAAAGFCNAYAGITLPNAASIALHHAAGFDEIGVFPSVGYKFGAWHDVAWFHRRLRAQPPAGDAS